MLSEPVRYALAEQRRNRLLDVFLIGPFMIWFGQRVSGPEWAKATMTVLGGTTILYNAARYMSSERQK